MRDDFAEEVKRVIASRANQRCSNPDCRATTCGPQDDPAKFLNFGVAAHITAASPGGPRYDATLTSEQRSSASNGIWLCQNCAKLVDNDESQFDVGLLKAWKYIREHDARMSIGQTAPPVQDTDSQRKCRKILQWVGKQVMLVKMATPQQEMSMGARPWASQYVAVLECNKFYVRLKVNDAITRSIPLENLRFGRDDKYGCIELLEYSR